MRTESTIVIRARKALATGADIDIHVPKDIESTTFYFRHGRFANSFTEWWKLCKELGIQPALIIFIQSPIQTPSGLSSAKANS